jgi:phage gpG-like protein
MAGFAIRLDIQDGPARAVVVDLRQRGENTTPAMKIIGEIGRTSIVKNFEAGGRPTPWKKSKRTIKEGGITLTKTRRLANSITSKAGRDSVDIGTNAIQARIHNLGGEIKHPARERVLHFSQKTRGQMSGGDLFAKRSKARYAMKVSGKAYTITMPKREFMLLQPEDWTEIRAALVEYLAGRQ